MSAKQSSKLPNIIIHLLALIVCVSFLNNVLVTKSIIQGKDALFAKNTDYSSTAIHHEPTSCISNAFHQLCSSFSELMSEDSLHHNTTHDSETILCHKDPETFLKNQNLTKCNPIKTQLATRALMYDKQIRRLSVGASKQGVCSDVVMGHTLCTDREQLDLLETSSWMSLILATHKQDNDDSTLDVEGFDVVFSEHVVEHFGLMQAEQITAASFLMLKPGGRFRVAVPDGYKPSSTYQQYVRPGATPSGAGQKHMVVWTVDTLPPHISQIRFQNRAEGIL